MKTLILAALIISLGLASCSITQPEEGVYSRQQRGYNNPNYQYDSNYQYDDRYTTQRVYDYNTGRYYDVVVYNTAPEYNSRVYQNRNYRRDYNRDYDRRDNDRREYRDYNVRRETPVEQPREQRVEQTKRLPDGTTISPDGTVTLPNGQVRRNNR